MNCPICFMPVNEAPLKCGHTVHLACVQKAYDTMAVYRKTHGYSLDLHGRCPLCRRVIPEISGKITLTYPDLTDILEKYRNGRPFQELVQEKLSTQVDESVLAEYSATMACLVWINRTSLPGEISLKREYGRFRSCVRPLVVS